MQPVTRSELEALVDEWDAAVERDPALDPFCARSAWQLAHHDAFAPERPLWLAREGDAWLVLAQRKLEQGGALLEPLENTWGFASPLIGRDAPALLARSLARRRRPVVLLGLPLDHERLASLAKALSPRWGARALAPTTRYVASLEGGLEGWLSRRSSAFRRNLRATLRAVAAAGIRFRRLGAPICSELDALYARVLDVEARSWKSGQGGGADSEPMRSFYANLWPRLASRGQLRLLFAEREGHAVGHLHGAAARGHFRGLQFSFDDALRGLGLGNALQYEMLRWLAEDGAQSYDLGAHSAYKARWAEPGLKSFGLLLQPLARRL